MAEATFKADTFFSSSVLAAPNYQIDAPHLERKLDQNELPWDCPTNFKELVLSEISSRDWNRYPGAHSVALENSLAAYLKIDPRSVLTGAGSDSLIAALIEATHSDIVYAEPSFPLYAMRSRMLGRNALAWPLDRDFSFTTDTLPRLSDGALLLVATPNNPTGTTLSLPRVEALCTENPRALVFVDEAYFEFAEDDLQPLLAQHDNLILSRTFSKACGLAGIRFGYLLAHPDLIVHLRKFRLPYALNLFSETVVSLWLQSSDWRDFSRRSIQAIVEERRRVFSAIESSSKASGSYRIVPSSANFHLLQWADNTKAQSVYESLQKSNILVRNVSRLPGLTGCLRMSLGTREDNDLLIKAVAAL